MREEVVIGGYGGQGIILAGKFLAYLAMKEGMFVTYFPSYGAEMRGGTANCAVIISSGEISSPICSSPGSVIAMNEPSVEKFSPRLRKNGLLIINSSLSKSERKRTDIEIIKIPADDLSKELGNIRAANMIMLGKFLSVKKITSIENACSLLEKVLPVHQHSLMDINKKALRTGYCL